MEVGPRDLLYAIINTLSYMRGHRSVLLENLLNRSQDVLGWNNYTNQGCGALPTQPDLWPHKLTTDTYTTGTEEVDLETFNHVRDIGGMEELGTNELGTICIGGTEACYAAT